MEETEIVMIKMKVLEIDWRWTKEPRGKSSTITRPSTLNTSIPAAIHSALWLPLDEAPSEFIPRT